MKIIRYQDRSGAIHYGAQQPDGTARHIEGDIFGAYTITNEMANIQKLLTPIQPTTLLCIGLNYRRHADEGGAPYPAFPVLFFKGLNTVQHPGDPIQIPTALPSQSVDYEAELAVVIGKSCKNVSKAQALEYVLGYTCANDVSERDWQGKCGGQWCRGKTFDTFAPLGPCLVTREDIPNPNALRLRCTVSGVVMQDWNTDDMIFDVPTLIEFLSASTTLLPGTVILTGTPHGIGAAQKPPRFLHDGDTVTVEIDGIGALTNPVVDEK